LNKEFEYYTREKEKNNYPPPLFLKIYSPFPKTEGVVDSGELIVESGECRMRNFYHKTIIPHVTLSTIINYKVGNLSFQMKMRHF
jgi:hypothetical protein